MSRKAKNAIELPKGVEASMSADTITVKGPRGTLQQKTLKGVSISVEEGKLSLTVDDALQDKLPGAHGLYWSLTNNMVTGVSAGFTKDLELIGVGYRAAVKGNELDLQLGFSHPTALKIPEGIEVKVEKNTNVAITGNDKQVVGQFAAQVRGLRPPEPYKGKGVRYKDEYVRRKAGKAGKK